MKTEILRGRKYSGRNKYYARDAITCLLKEALPPMVLANKIVNMNYNTIDKKYYHETKTVYKRLVNKKTGILKKLKKLQYVDYHTTRYYWSHIGITLKGLLASLYYHIYIKKSNVIISQTTLNRLYSKMRYPEGVGTYQCLRTLSHYLPTNLLLYTWLENLEKQYEKINIDNISLTSIKSELTLYNDLILKKIIEISQDIVIEEDETSNKCMIVIDWLENNLDDFSKFFIDNTRNLKKISVSLI